ncbi:MAG TPA: hypothetical protein DDY77_02250 [Clostridiales bacterium]|nr:hypothetical protein [Clostridiales bacterium]
MFEEVLLAMLKPLTNYYNQLIVAAWLFAIGQKPRKYGVYAIVALSCVYLFTFNVIGNISIGWFDMRTLIVFSSIFIILFASLKINVFHALFMTSVSYTLQQFCFYIARLFGVGSHPHSIGYDSLYVGIVIVVYTLFYMFVMRRLKNADFEIKRKQIFIAICVCVVIVASVISSYARVYEWQSITSVWYGLMCSVLLIFAEVGFIGYNSVEKENLIMEEVNRAQLKQSERLKVNIDAINRKAHDLKHFLSAMSFMTDEERKNSLKEIKDTIELYDSTVVTGNEVLDAVLNEKMFYCKSCGIRMTALINGSDFSFMDKADVYSLFGNALDNAINYLQNISDVEKRVVTVVSEKWLDMSKLSFENYIEKDIELVDGLPVIKNNSNYHGYGTKSMKYIAEKYKGEFKISSENNKFTVCIIFSAH